MDKNKILDILKQLPGIGDVEEIQYEPEYLVVRMFYDYDVDELEAARDYANSQSNAADDEDKWFSEYYIPYLIDLAVDEVRDSIEEIVDSRNVIAEYISYEPDREDDSCEFIAVFADEGKEFDIDDILDDIGI